MASYTVGETLTLVCVVDASINTTSRNVTHLWQCSGCFADGLNTSNIMQQLTDRDSSMISCLVNVDGAEYMSDVFNLQVTQGDFSLDMCVHYCIVVHSLKDEKLQSVLVSHSVTARQLSHWCNKLLDHFPYGLSSTTLPCSATMSGR